MTETAKPVRLLSFRELNDRYGIAYSRGHLWRLIKAGEFPKPRQLNSSVGVHGSRKSFREDEILDWLASRVSGGKAA